MPPDFREPNQTPPDYATTARRLPGAHLPPLPHRPARAAQPLTRFPSSGHRAPPWRSGRLISWPLRWPDPAISLVAQESICQDSANALSLFLLEIRASGPGWIALSSAFVSAISYLNEVTSNGAGPGSRLLTELNCQLPFRLRHFAPQFLQVGLHGHVVRILAQSQREPAIRRGQIMGSAQARRVQSPHFAHSRGIRLIGRRLQQAHAAIAILRYAASINIFLRLGYRIDWLDGRVWF